MAQRAKSTGGILSAAYVGSAALALLLSLLWWRADVNRSALEYCPDGFCFLADRFHAVLTRWDAASVLELHRFALTYLHAHSPLGPLLQAGLTIVTRHQIVAYMLVSAAATLVAWLCVRRTIERAWPLPPGLGLIVELRPASGARPQTFTLPLEPSGSAGEPSTWPEQDRTSVTYQLPLDPGLAPDTYTLAVRLVDASGEHLPVTVQPPRPPGVPPESDAVPLRRVQAR